MKTITIALAGAAAIALSAGAAQAQRWLPIVERQAMIEDRIEAGLATGDLTAGEAARLRADMHALVRLEGSYRWNGLSAREKVDLDRRFATLHDSLRIARAEGRDYAVAPTWTSIEDRKMALDRRIERGLANGDLTAAEAEDLRADFDAIASAEARYRLDGLSASERADLDARFDELAERIRWERNDRQYGYSRY